MIIESKAVSIPKLKSDFAQYTIASTGCKLRKCLYRCLFKCSI